MHRFKSDLIYNMDHMRILGTEPSSVILSQTKYLKTMKSYAQKVPICHTKNDTANSY